VSIALLALILAGCGASADASDGNPTAKSTSTTTVAPTTTTTVPPPYSFDGSVPPPKLVNTGTDYEAIYRSLSEYGDWLLAHQPDASLVRGTSSGRPSERLTHDVDVVRVGTARLVEVQQPLKYKLSRSLPSAASLRVQKTCRHRDSSKPMYDDPGTTFLGTI
jgi:hypothetical protein